MDHASNRQGKILVMLEMQAALNSLGSPDWRERDLPWHRAIYVEAGEYLEHLGAWKWWKKGEPDFPQANMELVDIWHFGMSWYMQLHQGAPLDQVAERLGGHVEYFEGIVAQKVAASGLSTGALEQRHMLVDALVAAAGRREFDLKAFLRLLALSGIDFDELYRRYVGKNVLNCFRQDHGYKAGTYVKVWAGREDNVHLDEILNALPDDEALPTTVRAALNARYEQLVLRAD